MQLDAISCLLLYLCDACIQKIATASSSYNAYNKPWPTGNVASVTQKKTLARSQMGRHDLGQSSSDFTQSDLLLMPNGDEPTPLTPGALMSMLNVNAPILHWKSSARHLGRWNLFPTDNYYSIQLIVVTSLNHNVFASTTSEHFT